MKWLFFVLLHFDCFIRQHTLQAYFEFLTTGNLVKHGFPSMIDIYLTQDSNRFFLPWGATELKFEILHIAKILTDFALKWLFIHLLI